MDEVELVKSKIDIVEFIGGYVQLKQAGRNFKGLSPFKSEKTPSFMVSAEKNIWHDFSSGEGGDVISFVMKMEGVTFPEALEMLARRAGVELTKRRGSASGGSKQKLYEAVEEAVKYYHVSLSKNPAARDYLMKDRKLTAATIRRFKLGYAPDAWEALTGYLAKKGYDIETLKRAGLAGQKEGRKNAYDLFRGRVMFPIYDNQGRAIGFSGRILDGGDAAKYINTPQTPIYNKSLAIYGLAQAKESIRERGEVLMVEGNMDAVSLAQAGVANVVAVSGTALTEEQLRTLGYLAETVLVCFDSDEAGQNATYRAVQLAAAAGMNLKVITLPLGKDPDELVRRDKHAFVKAYDEAMGGVEYIFAQAEQRFDKSGRGKKRYSDFVSAVVQKLSDPIERDHYIKKLAQKLDVDERAVREKLHDKPVEQSTQSNTEVAPRALKGTHMAQMEASLAELLVGYDYTRDCIEDVAIEQLTDRHKTLYSYLKKHPKSKLDAIALALPDLADYVKILALRAEEAYTGASRRDIALEAFTQARHLITSQQKAARVELSHRLAEAEQSGDTTARDKLLAQIQQTLNEDL